MNTHIITPHALWFPISEVCAASFFWLMRSLTPRSPRKRLGDLLLLIPPIWVLHLLWVAMAFYWKNIGLFLPMIWSNVHAVEETQVMFALPRSENSLVQLDQAAALATAVVAALLSTYVKHRDGIQVKVDITREYFGRVLESTRRYSGHV